MNNFTSHVQLEKMFTLIYLVNILNSSPNLYLTIELTKLKKKCVCE